MNVKSLTNRDVRMPDKSLVSINVLWSFEGMQSHTACCEPKRSAATAAAQEARVAFCRSRLLRIGVVTPHSTNKEAK